MLTGGDTSHLLPFKQSQVMCVPVTYGLDALGSSEGKGPSCNGCDSLILILVPALRAEV